MSILKKSPFRKGQRVFHCGLNRPAIIMKAGSKSSKIKMKHLEDDETFITQVPNRKLK